MKKSIALITLTLFALTSCWSQQKEEVKIEIPKKQAQFKEIKKEDFNEQIKLIWKITPMIETPVSALVSWTIKTIHVEVWQKVKAGQVLATLNLGNTTYSTSFDTAKTAYSNTLDTFNSTLESIASDLKNVSIQLENAKTTRENTYSTTEKQLKIAEEQLNNIKTQKSNTIKSSSTSIELAQKSLDTSKLNLENFLKNKKETLSSFDIKKKTLEDKKNWLNNTVDSTADTIIANLENTSNYADTILGVTDLNRNVNDGYESLLGAKDSSSKIDWENAFRKINDAIILFKKTNFTDKQVKLLELKKLVEYSMDLHEKMIKLLDNTITTSSFTDTTLIALKTNIKTNQATVLTINGSIVTISNSYNDINNAIEDLATTIRTTETSLSTQESSLNQWIIIAQTNLDNTKNNITTSIDSISWNETLIKSQLENTIATIKSARDGVDNAVKIAEAQYKSTQAKLEAQKSQLKSQLDSSKWSKELAWIQLNNTQIIAPFSWVITARNIEVGSLVSPWAWVFTISASDSVKAKIDITWDNIEYLKINQLAIIKKNEESFSGNVSLLSPSNDVQTKLYKAEVTFGKKPNLKLGDLVDVYITKEKWGEKTVLLPFSSILNQWQWNYAVFVVWNDKIVKLRQVKLGSQNSEDVQILSWLQEWEKVVISWTLNLQDWDTIE